MVMKKIESGAWQIVPRMTIDITVTRPDGTVERTVIGSGEPGALGANLQRWLQQLGNPYAVVAEDREGRTAIDWGVYGAPETFLIGPDGIVLYKHIAPMTMEVWNTEFLPRIEAARAAKGSQS